MTDQVPIRILVADDHPVVREGLVAMLSTQPGLAVVAEAADGTQAVERALTHQPDIVLMDIELPPSDGIEATAEIGRRCPGAKVIMFTAFEEGGRIEQALRAGARGYLLKGVPRQEIFRAIREVHRGGSHLQAEVASKLVQRLRAPGPAPLTPRQREVVRMLAQGASNKQIALALGLRERTVKYHLAGICQRLGAANRTEALAIAIKRGLV